MSRWLILVGGGGCGRAQGGALDALESAGLLRGLAGIVGTSVGGLNACALAVGLAQGRGVALVREAWSRIQKDEDVYKPSLTALVARPWAHPLDAMGVAKGFLSGRAACSTEPLEKLVRDLLGGWSTEKIKGLGGPELYTRALSYDRKRAETLCGDLVPMALATSAIEGVFQRRWGYGDGGAVDNEPIGVAVAKGATEILVVFCGPESPNQFTSSVGMRVADEQDKSSATGLDDAIATLNGLVDRGEALADEEATRAEKAGVSVVYCYPEEPTGSALDFTERGLWAMGQMMAKKAIEAAKAKGWIY